MKKIATYVLLLATLIGCLASCQTQTASPTVTDATETVEKNEEVKTEKKTEEKDKKTEEEVKTMTQETPAVTQETPAAPDHMLDGKKIIFVGNSYTYYGNAVIPRDVSLRQQSIRMNDSGYFYQICKSRGADVNVTNWTFGNHGLADLFGKCAAGRGCDGVDHKSDLKDNKYDYVFLQERTGKAGAEITSAMVLKNVDDAVAFFRAANPDVKFFFLVQKRVYEQNHEWLSILKSLPAKGVTVVEWGALVEDVVTGKTKVPGAKQTYNKDSFVINQSKDDGYHPNMLAGYITAQMAYCAITGESAQGQEYSFCTNASMNPNFNADTYIKKYYKYNGATTNLKEIFASPEDMAGLQKLMDQYLAAHRYKTY